MNEDEPIETFGASEFVFTKNDEGKIYGGGYTINSFLLNNNIIGGGKTDSHENVSLDNLAVPAGLFYINAKTKPTKEYHYEEHTALSDDIMDALYDLVSVDNKRKRGTKKHLVSIKTTNKRTRRKK